MEQRIKKPDILNRVDGTLVSAALEVNQLFHFDGQMDNLVLLVSRNHSWVKLFRERGIRVFCLEQFTGQTANSTARLLCNQSSIDFLKELPSPVRVLMFKPDARTESTLAEHGIEIIGCNPSIARKLENKLLFPELAEQCGLPIASWQNLRLQIDSSGDSEQHGFEFPFICQMAKGFSGNRTFLISNPADWRLVCKAFNGRNCRISRYLKGDTWTLNGCVRKNGQVVCSKAFLQHTRLLGNPDHSLPQRVGSRGITWYAQEQDIEHQHRESNLMNAMVKIGKVLHQRGYHGFYGADFLVPDAESEPGIMGIEVNPRVTASACILTPLEMSPGTLSILECHILDSISIEFQVDRVKTTSFSAGGQRIYREGDTIPSIIDVESGIYTIKKAGLQKSRPGFSSSELAISEALIWRSESSETSGEQLRFVFTHPLPSVFLQLL